MSTVKVIDVCPSIRCTYGLGEVQVVPLESQRLTDTTALTMHGVSKEVELSTEYLGKGKDPWGNTRYGFHAETTINRKDFGMAWNEALEAGGLLVGDEVEISLDVAGVPAK